MTAPQRTTTRRAVLAAAGLLPLAACSWQDDTEVAPTQGPVATASPAASGVAAVPTASRAASAGRRHERLAALERRYDARLGVFALATGTGDTVEHRADERFAFCSTFKGLAVAAVLHRNAMSRLDEVVRYTEDDLLKSSSVTRGNLATGMTIRDLCHAAVVRSDGTAGNLLLRLIGGPPGLTAYLRGLDDRVTRSDRPEPKLTSAVPGDPRDTTTPRAIGGDYQRIVLGAALPSAKRDFLRDLLERANVSEASRRRIRAGVPKGWQVADKTGTGYHGTMNDIAVVWPPRSAPPLVVAIMSSRTRNVLGGDDTLIAEAAGYVVATLAG